MCNNITDPEYAYKYAKNVIKGIWPKGEAAIICDINSAHLYFDTFQSHMTPEEQTFFLLKMF